MRYEKKPVVGYFNWLFIKYIFKIHGKLSQRNDSLRIKEKPFPDIVEKELREEHSIRYRHYFFARFNISTIT
jgi:hypothetical protein